MARGDTGACGAVTKVPDIGRDDSTVWIVRTRAVKVDGYTLLSMVGPVGIGNRWLISKPRIERIAPVSDLLISTILL